MNPRAFETRGIVNPLTNNPFSVCRYREVNVVMGYVNYVDRVVKTSEMSDSCGHAHQLVRDILYTYVS